MTEVRAVPRPPMKTMRAIADDPRFAAPAATMDGERLVVGTDGSFHWRFGAGYGWVRSDGEFAWQAASVTSALEAEVLAIDSALHALPRGASALVVVDCREAIRLVRSTVTAPPADAQKYRSVQGRLYSIWSALAVRQVELRWVRGHADNALNDGADRPARLARTARFNQTEDAVTREIAAGIAADAVAQATFASS